MGPRRTPSTDVETMPLAYHEAQSRASLKRCPTNIIHLVPDTHPCVDLVQQGVTFLPSFFPKVESVSATSLLNFKMSGIEVVGLVAGIVTFSAVASHLQEGKKLKEENVSYN